MDGGEADDLAQFVDSDEQGVRWRMIDHELVPFVRRKHRLPSEVSEVRPSFTNGGIEHRTDLLGVARDGWSNGGQDSRSDKAKAGARGAGLCICNRNAGKFTAARLPSSAWLCACPARS